MFTLITPQVSAASNGSCSTHDANTGVYNMRCTSSFSCTGTPDPRYPNCYFRFEVSASASTAVVTATLTSAAGSISCSGVGGCSNAASFIVAGGPTHTMTCQATVIGSTPGSVSCNVYWYAWTWDRP